MIGHYSVEVPIGTKFSWFYNYNRDIILQPCVVIRKATKEEYIEFYESDEGTGHKIPGPISDLDGLFFYEISTD